MGASPGSRSAGGDREPDLLLRQQALVLEHVHDAVVVTDVHGVVRSWNGGAQRIYGWAADEIVGTDAAVLLFPEDRESVGTRLCAPLLEPGPHELTVRSRHRSGEEVFVAARLWMLRDESGDPTGVVACSNDITRERRAADELERARGQAEESLALLQSLFRAAPVGLAFLDRELRYVHVNQTLAEFNGIAARDHLGRRLREVVPDLADTLEPIYLRVMETRRPVVNLDVSGETPARPGEVRHWLNNYSPVEGAGGEILGVVVVVIEVTDRLRAEEEVRRERDFAEGLIRLAQAIVLVLDGEGRIVRFNPFMEKVSGYRLEEVSGRDWFRTFLPRRDRRRLRELFRRSVEGADTRGNINPIVTKSGKERQISWWATALRDAEGNAQGLLSIGHDITDLLAAQQAAMRSERLAAIGRSFTAIAHESRNELHALHLGLHVLSRAVGGDRELAACVQGMLESRQRLERIYDELRAFAAPLLLDVAPCDLLQVWRRAWASLEEECRGRSCELIERVDARARCEADALRLEQVFRNLFENALRACRDPVRIEISCSEVATLAGPELRVAVRDSGPGIDPEYRERIFEPFFTTSPVGTGLGLAIARRLMAAHGGTLIVGDGGSGAELVLTLPLER